MERDASSHKGENGKVAIIGGSRHMHGAPLISASAAEASGVDLVFVALPDWHENAAKQYSLNFQVHPFQDDDIAMEDIDPLLELLATMDSAVIGPGINRANEESLKALDTIIGSASCSLVLDASALQSTTLELVKGKGAVLTPHLGELERMGLKEKEITKKAEESGSCIFFKGPTDHIAFPDGTETELTGGNAGLTVGGTGDVLAGLIAGLIAQHMDPAEACKTAGTIVKQAGEKLAKTKGHAYTAMDVVQQIPALLLES